MIKLWVLLKLCKRLSILKYIMIMEQVEVTGKKRLVTKRVLILVYLNVKRVKSILGGN